MMSDATHIFLLIFSVTLVSFELTFTVTMTVSQNVHTVNCNKKLLKIIID